MITILWPYLKNQNRIKNQFANSNISKNIFGRHTKATFDYKFGSMQF